MLRHVETIFGVLWSDLAFADVEQFLVDAGSEPLSWEAKADDVRAGLQARKVEEQICAFANSENGGYLIIGAKQLVTNGPWTLPGLVQPPSMDLTTWVGQIARSISPMPIVDVRDLTPQAPRPFAVVWIPSVKEPPAMTKDGGIFVRVAGASIAVKDPRVLAELFGRGVVARTTAEDLAAQAIDEMQKRAGPLTYAHFVFSPVGAFRGQDSLAFRKATEDAIRSAIQTDFPDGHERIVEFYAGSGWIAGKTEAIGLAPRTNVFAFRSGVVGVSFNAAKGATPGPAVEIIVSQRLTEIAWRLATDVLSSLGASGRIYIVTRTTKDFGTMYVVGFLPNHGAVWSTSEPWTADLALVERDIRRATGEYVLDPD